MTDVLTDKVGTTTDFDEELVHYSCCADENLALCGELDLGDFVREAPEADMCIVCVELQQQPSFCPKYDKCKYQCSCKGG